ISNRKARIKQCRCASREHFYAREQFRGSSYRAQYCFVLLSSSAEEQTSHRKADWDNGCKAGYRKTNYKLSGCFATSTSTHRDSIDGSGTWVNPLKGKTLNKAEKTEANLLILR